MTHTKMAFPNRDYSFQDPKQIAMHSTRSQLVGAAHQPNGSDHVC